MSAAAFSRVTVRIGGAQTDTGRIKMELVRSLRTRGTLAVCGFVESVLKMSVYGELAVAPGDRIEIALDGMRFADHYVDGIKRSGDVVHLTAHDLMRRLEMPYSGESEASSALLIPALARECGFAGAAGVPLMTLYPGDLKGRCAKQILMTVSEYGCGVWSCSNTNMLVFTPFTEATAEYAMGDAVLNIHSVKGPITAVTAENTASSVIYSAGSGSWHNRVRLRGNAFTRERTEAVAAALAGKTVQSFYARHIPVTVPTEGISGFVREGRTYIAYRTEIHFGGEVYADACTEDICEDEYDYIPVSQLEKGLVEGRIYGGACADGTGFGICDEAAGDVRSAARHVFSAVTDNVTRFDGAVMDGTMPDRIERITDTSRRIVYGGSSYLLSYVQSGGVKTDIRLVKEET